MTIICLPIDASAGVPSYTAQQTRQAFSGHLQNGSSRRLGALSGRRPGLGLEVSATSSDWSVTAGSCVVDAAFTTTQGPYMVASTTVVTGSMTAANGSNPRKDIVYVRVSDDDIDSSGNRYGEILYLAGTAAASPSAPATPARSLLLAVISVPTSGGGSPSVATSNLWATGAGGLLPVASATARDAQVTDPYDGMAVYRLDADAIEVYNGSSWDRFSPDFDPPLFHGFHSAAVTIPTGTSPTGIVMDSESFDTDGGHSTSSNTSRYTPNVAGYWEFTARVRWANGSTVGRRICEVAINGTASNDAVTEQPGVSVGTTGGAQQATGIFAMNGTTDYAQALVVQDSGGGLDTVAGYCGLTAKWLRPL